MSDSQLRLTVANIAVCCGSPCMSERRQRVTVAELDAGRRRPGVVDYARELHVGAGLTGAVNDTDL